MGLGYGQCLLRRRWAGGIFSSQPAYIFHSHGNGRSSTLTGSEGRQCAGPRLVEGQLPAWRRCQHSGPPLGGSRRCSARNPWLAASDGWSLQPPDRWDSACQPSSCPSHGSNLEADRLHRGPRLEPPIDGHVLCQTTQTSTNIATADICNVWVEMDNIFWSSVMWPPQLLALSSEYEKAKGKCNPHWVIVHGDMASQRARCGQISSFVAFAIHVNGGKDKLLHESAQFCRQGFTLARFLCHLTCPLDTLSNHLAAGILLSIQAC